MKRIPTPARMVTPVLVLIACTCSRPFITIFPTPTAVPGDASVSTATPAPTRSASDATQPPAESTPSEPGTGEGASQGSQFLYYQAMRPGFEADVDPFIEGTLYQFALTLSDNPVHIEGTEQVRFTNRTPDTLDRLMFRLYPNGLYRQNLLQVQSALLDGEAVEPELAVSDTALVIPLAQALAPGGSVQVDLAFTLDLPPDKQVGYGRLGDTQVIVLSSFLPILSVYEAGGWWMEFPSGPGDPAYSDIALFDVTLTAPSALQVAATGTTLETTDSGNQATHRFVTGPVRDFSMALSESFELDTAVESGTTVNVWSLPGIRQADQNAVEVAADSMRVFNAQFGEYPYNELDVVEAPLEAGGIEYPGLIYIAEGLWDTQVADRVIVHEVAHQWWYALVGNNQVGEPWIDEGLTEYSVIVYYTEAVSAQAGQEVRGLFQDELDMYLDQGNEREPVGLPADEYSGIEYRVFVYSAGALFYSYLGDEYGYDAVTAFLQDYFTRYRFNLAENAELEQLVEEHFGPDAVEFFTDWIYTGGDN